MPGFLLSIKIIILFYNVGSSLESFKIYFNQNAIIVLSVPSPLEIYSSSNNNTTNSYNINNTELRLTLTI